MGLTYTQKQKIIDYLADRSQWKSLFDDAFYKDQKRRWKAINTPIGVSASLKPDEKQAYISHGTTGASCIITKIGSQIRIDDESGRCIKIRAGNVTLNNSEGSDVTVSPILSSDQITSAVPDTSDFTLEELGVTVCIGKQGEKTFFFHDEGLEVSFESPYVIEKQKLPPGRFLHAIAFDDALAKEWGIEEGIDLLNAVKLIIARDMAIETDLRAFNEIDPARAFAMMGEYAAKLEQQDPSSLHYAPLDKLPEFGDVSRIQKDWTDATDFEGYYVGLPNQFSVAKTDDGFEIMTYLDNREKIWIQGALVKKAIDNDIKPVQLLDDNMTARSFLHILDSGETVKDHRGRAWVSAIYETKDAAVVAHMARLFMKENFDLSSYHGIAISHADDQCVFAMDSEVFAQVKAGYDASMELRAMIKKGSTDKDRMKELIEQGAKVRYINPMSADRNKTWADFMANAGNKALLSALEEHSGVHDLAYKMPAP